MIWGGDYQILKKSLKFFLSGPYLGLKGARYGQKWVKIDIKDKRTRKQEDKTRRRQEDKNKVKARRPKRQEDKQTRRRLEKKKTGRRIRQVKQVKPVKKVKRNS